MQGRRLGNLTINRVLEMHTHFDPLWFFPETTATDWTAVRDWLAPDGMDRNTGWLRFPVQSWVVRTSHHTVLVDTCVGNHKHRPYLDEWHQRDDGAYLTGLAALGLAPEDIDIVMCTHLHPDHIGWNTRLVDGRWVPTFPNARYVFSKKELDVWTEKHAERPNAGLVDSVLPVVEAGRAELVLNDHAVDDELWLESTPGHTPDHVAVRFASLGEDAVMTGDLIHTPVQCLHPEWAARPDFDTALAVRTRRAFLERYADTRTLVCTMHFPLPSAGRLISTADAFRFESQAMDG